MEGGMVSSSDSDVVNLARSLSWWGRDCHCVGAQNLMACGMCGERFKNWLPDFPGIVDHKYVFTNMGYNLKPLDLQGGIGLVQLSKWEKIHALRRSNKAVIQSILETVPGVRVVDELPEAETSWFGVPIVCENTAQKTQLVAHLEQNRIQTRNYFAGNILLHPGYQHLGDASLYPRANQTLNQVFFLGCSPTITASMIEYIRDVISKFQHW
jgi:CDP-6-deoxy-D-xylo-4-hexulose-3-dehydrase